MDYDLCLRLARRCRGDSLPRVLASRRLHGASKTASLVRAFHDDAMRALDKVFADPDLPGAIRAARRVAYARRYLVSAHRAFLAGHYAASRKWLSQAITLDPSPWRFETMVSLVLLAESACGVGWIRPGIGRRWFDRRFRRQMRSVSLAWGMAGD